MCFFISRWKDSSGKDSDLYGEERRTESHAVKSTYRFKGRNVLKKKNNPVTEFFSRIFFFNKQFSSCFCDVAVPVLLNCGNVRLLQ